MKRMIAAAFTGMLLCSVAHAQELKIGTTYNPSVDPHYLYIVPNIAFNRHLYEPLVAQTNEKKLIPGLAEKWEIVEPTKWRFHLRKGVKFHNGSDFTADDVVFSYDRVTSIPNNPGSYASYLTNVAKVEKVDDFTIDITTSVPNPLLPEQTNGILIVSKAAAENHPPADFNSGASAIGTGPFKYGEFRQGESLKLTRFDGYWGEKPAWESVNFRVMTEAGARTAALESGEVDMIDLVRPSDAARLSQKDGISVAPAKTNRIFFLGAMANDKPSKLVTDNSGKPLEKNPLSDARVRKAISVALNREAIADRLFGGYAEPASQLATPGTIGYLDSVKPDVQSLDEAKKLLADAGYSDGFKLAFWCPNLDVYPQVCQAVAQMVARINIKADVQLMPSSTFFGKVNPPDNEAPLFLTGWNNLYGDALNAMIPNVRSYDKARNVGDANAQAFSDPELDKALDAATQELDPAKHKELVETAMKIAVEKYAVIPVTRVDTIFATRKEIIYSPGTLNLTTAMWAKPTAQ